MRSYQQLLESLRQESASGSYVQNLITIGAIEGGGAAPLSYASMQLLLELQNLHGLSGDLLEIGVFHGHTLGLLASASRQGEIAIGGDIDPVTLKAAAERIRKELCAALPWLFIKEINCSSASLEFRRALLTNAGNTGVRFAHIDGEHSYELAKRDMELCDEVMAPWGLICVDDVFNLGSPSVTEALFAFNSQRDWELLLFTPGKAFLCRPRYFPFYRKLLIQISNLLRDLLGMQSGMAVTTHDSDQGYLSIFETEGPYYQVVGKSFTRFEDFQNWHQQP